jgi:hypothetical protein
MADHESHGSEPGLTHEEARAIAARSMRAAGRAPNADQAAENNQTALDEPRGGTTDTDEDRIEAAPWRGGMNRRRQRSVRLGSLAAPPSL